MSFLILHCRLLGHYVQLVLSKFLVFHLKSHFFFASQAALNAKSYHNSSNERMAKYFIGISRLTKCVLSNIVSLIGLLVLQEGSVLKNN
jgi:hypothetical protein